MRRMSLLLSLLCCIALKPVGFAEQPPLPVLTAAKALVDIEVVGRGSLSGKLEIARASGVLVEGYVLTCGHLFWSGDDPDDQLTLGALVVRWWTEEGLRRFSLEDLTRCRPNPVVDATLDLALCHLRQQPKGPKLHLGEAALAGGVWLLGYEDPPTLTTIRGIVRMIRDQEVWIEVDRLPRPGMSGSPVFSEDGVLVGLVIATVGNRYVVAAPALAARKLRELIECPAESRTKDWLGVPAWIADGWIHRRDFEVSSNARLVNLGEIGDGISSIPPRARPVHCALDRRSTLRHRVHAIWFLGVIPCTHFWPGKC